MRGDGSESRFAGRFKWFSALASHRWMGELIGGGFLIAVIFVGLTFHRMVDGDSETDFIGSYVSQARSFLGGTIAIDAYRGPLYPIALGLLHVPLRAVGLGLLETGIVLSALSASLIIALVFRLLKRLYSPTVALSATLLLIVNPHFFRYSYTTGNDMFFSALATLCVYLMLAGNKYSWRRLVGAGIVAGLTYLTRYNGIAIVLAAIACVLIVRPPGITMRRRLLGALTIAACFMLVITPWGVYTLSERGSFLHNKNYHNMAMTFHVGDEAPERFRAEHGDEFDSFVDVVAWDPAGFARKVPSFAWGNLVKSLEGLGWPVGILVVLGMLSVFLRRPTRSQSAYFVFGGLFFAVLSVVFYKERFFLFLTPVFLAIAVQGVLNLAGVLRKETLPVGELSILVLVLVIYGGVESARYNVPLLPGGEPEFRTMGEAFQNEFGDQKGKRVVERKPFFSYFAGLEHVPMPVVDSVDELMKHVRETDADYLFFSFIAHRTRQPAAELIDPRVAHPGLEFIANTRIGTLYEVVPPRSGRP